jgi:hypothetical protein
MFASRFIVPFAWLTERAVAPLGSFTRAKAALAQDDNKNYDNKNKLAA